MSLTDMMVGFFARGTALASPLFTSNVETPPPVANILSGSLTHTATTAATTIITVPAGRTWEGNISLSASVCNSGGTAGTAAARGVVTTAGAGATPAGTIAAVEAKAGANVATGTVGSQNSNSNIFKAVVVAPVGNAVTVQLATTIAGTSGIVDVTASGELL